MTYTYKVMDRIRYSKTIKEARRALIEGFRKDEGHFTGLILNGAKTVGWVVPMDGTIYWMETKQGIDYYTPLEEDGSAVSDAVPTDVIPGTEPEYFVELDMRRGNVGFAHLQTARMYISGMAHPKLGMDFYRINTQQGFLEEHLLDDNNHHYLTYEEWTQETADKRTYYKCNRYGNPTDKIYDDWGISDRFREEKDI